MAEATETKTCTIVWEKRHGSDIVDIKAVKGDVVLFSKHYLGGNYWNDAKVDATFTEVYEWTQRNGYTLEQGKK